MSTFLRVVFMGTPDFAVPSFAALHAWEGCRVLAAVSQPDRSQGRGRKTGPTPVKRAAEAAGVPVLQPEKIRSGAFPDTLASLAPDLIVVAAYGRILPSSFFSLARLGAINVHGSLLPQYRGAAPIQWAIMRGETETGITIMQMDEGLDTGDILHVRTLPIGEDDSAGTLTARMAELGGVALVEALELLLAGKISAQQQDGSRASLAPPLKKTDGLLDWRRDAEQICRHIRGVDPWPSAYTFLAGQRLRLFSPRAAGATADSAQPAGTLCRVGPEGLLVAAGSGAVFVRECQGDGGRRMAAAEYFRGRLFAPASMFGQGAPE